MSPDETAVLLAAATTGAVGLAGTALVALVPRSRPATAAFAAPFVVVAALAAGVAVASQQMLIDDYTSRMVLIVLAACAPMALLAGFLIARRVRALERGAAAERADREKARAVEASQRETIRWLSHDLRTPLAGIRALAETAIDGPARPDAAEHIVREVDRLDAMVDDIAELSRLHAEPRRTITASALDDLVSDAVASVLPLAAAEGVRVEAGTLSGDTVAVEPREVTRAITNIVRNAVQHTPAGERVTVSTTREGEHFVVSVTDACGGVAAADLEHLLEPGWRADTARSERGMGLGLAIADEVARAHGGRVEVRGVAPATGCTVRFVLRADRNAVLTSL